ncbi:tail fiber assembly protein [Escherichia coli]|uniref:tail fiber assembly protein n=1 Tax=Escherichia coli TaxID=562 RepID=UPI003F613E8B
MTQAKLNSEFIATAAGDVTVYNFNNETREYLSSSIEYLAVGVGIPANSCIDAPGEKKEGYTICRTADFTAWEYIADHRGETVYNIDTGTAIIISAPGDYPDGVTSLEPLTPHDKWNGHEWITDAVAQHAADVEIAESKQQQLINDAMQSISFIQLKLQAGRKLTDVESMKLNTVLDYIDAVTAIDTETAPNISWPVPPEV